MALLENQGLESSQQFQRHARACPNKWKEHVTTSDFPSLRSINYSDADVQ